jgi:hypothetical protein
MAIIINPYTIPSFFAGIISLVLGLYALYKNPKERATQIFFIMMMGIALWSLTPIIVQAQSTSDDALFWAKISNVGLLLIPTTLFHFSFIFRREKPVEFFKIAIVYGVAILMIVLLLGTNLFFTMADDPLIDGDGDISTGRGSGNYTEDQYSELSENDLKLFSFIDSNGDNSYTLDNKTLETLVYNGIYIVGYPEIGANLTPLENADNYQWVWFVDENEDENYTIGESLYLENRDLDQKLTYSYIAGPLYFLLIIFFFGLIIVSTINFFLFYRKISDNSTKKSILYLIFGLLAIVVFILSQALLASIFPVIFLDSAIALVISIFFTVAVLKYGILDIKLIIRKSMFYSAASLVVVICFVLVEEGMEILFAELAFSGSVVAGIIAAFVALTVFSIIRRGLKHQIDKLFPSVRYLDKEFQSRLSAYKATLVAMLSDRILSKKEEAALDTLRDKLEIQRKEHEKLMQEFRLEMGSKPILITSAR